MKRSSLLLMTALFATSSFIHGCSRGEQNSNISTTSVPHSAVKDQSIGNCWAYAVLGWAESLHLKATGEEINMSETYMTYWVIYDKLVRNTALKEVSLSGTWGKGKDILLERGYVLEGEFIPEEESFIRSDIQEKAVKIINEELKKGGELYGFSNRDPKKVIKVLDRAFGVDGRAAEKRARKAADLKVAGKNGSVVSLAHALGKVGKDEEWKQVVFMQPANLGKSHREKTLRRVMKALNDGMPVIMALMVDFDALDRQTNTFRSDLLPAEPKADNQGAHMVVLDDYTVDEVPGVGAIGEGEVSEELKELALQGRLRSLKAKNSWGENALNGFTRFDIDYLTSNHKWTVAGVTLPYTALLSVVLPPGY